MKLYIIFIILLLFFILYYNNLQIENFSNYKSPCGDYPELLHKVLMERRMKENTTDYDIFIPCSYNSCESAILAFENKETDKKLFLIDGCDWVGSKMALWELLKEYYGNNANKYMPESFLLDKPKDLERFGEYFKKLQKINPNQMYVLKNYAQRQEGLKLTRDYKEIINGKNKGWYLVQEYKYDPYLISKHKINFRYYLLIVCKNNTIEGYLHKDGFLYYTPKHYDENDMTFNKHITTGYIDRAIYDKNPLTLEDFRNYLGEKRFQWDNTVNNLMHGVMEAISKKICKNKKLDNHIRFQLFGCDVAPTSDLEASLMEINKGPDLEAKDERDKTVKLKVQNDIFAIIDPIDNENINDTRFIKIF
jgi:hypothetical protein